MRRILLIGPGGAGKSTLARRLAERLGLPLVHLDALYWKPGWEKTPTPAWEATVDALVRGEAWVMDGNFGGTLDRRLAACDTAILLDPSPWRCVWRVLLRRWRHRGRAREDMHAGCHERLDAAFLWWIAAYRWRSRPRVATKLRVAAARGVRIRHLRSTAEVEAFLATLPSY